LIKSSNSHIPQYTLGDYLAYRFELFEQTTNLANKKNSAFENLNSLIEGDIEGFGYQDLIGRK